MTPKVPPTPDEVRAEPCPHCEALPGAPCVTFGEPGCPPSPDFHGQRTHAAMAKRLRAEARESMESTDVGVMLRVCAFCDAPAICLRISAGHGLIGYLPVCGDHLRGRTPPLALFPEASALWLSPAQASRRPGMMREMVMLTLLRRQALADFAAFMECYERTGRGGGRVMREMAQRLALTLPVSAADVEAVLRRVQHLMSGSAEPGRLLQAAELLASVGASADDIAALAARHVAGVPQR